MRIRNVQDAIITQGAAGQTQIVAAPAAGLRIHVVGYAFTMDVAGTATWQSGNNAKSGAMNFAGNGGISAWGSEENPVLVCNPGEALNITTATGQAEGHLRYFVA